MKYLSALIVVWFYLFLPLGQAVVYEPPPFRYGNFSQFVKYDLHPHDGFAAGDFNGDGRDDVAAWHGASHRLVLYHADAGGNLQVAQVMQLPKDDHLVTIFIRFHSQVIDVNGDGRLDLVLFEEGTARFQFLETQPNGTFALPKIWRNTTFSWTHAPSWFARDLNGDGLADLVMTEDSSKFVIAFQREGFTFDRQWWPSSATFPGFEGNEVSVASVAANGRLDAAWTVTNAAGAKRTLLYRNEGETRFLPGVPLRVNSRTGAFLWGDLTEFDIDGDGLPDLLQRDPARRTIATYRGTGNEVFRLIHSQTAEVFGKARWLDLDQDGSLDLLQEDTERACYFLNDGKGRLGAPVCEANNHLEFHLRHVERADLNGDALWDRVVLAAEEERGEAYLRRSVAGQLIPRMEAPDFPANPVAGQNWKINLPVRSSYPHWIPPRGHIEVLVDGEKVAQLPLAPPAKTPAIAQDPVALASGEVLLPAGQFEVQFVYPGDRQYSRNFSEARSLLLPPTPTEVRLNLNAQTLKAGEELRAAVQVLSRDGRAVTPMGQVSLQRNGSELARLELLNGAATWKSREAPPGNGQMQAVYLGTRSFAESRSPALPVIVVGSLVIRNGASGIEGAAPGSLVQVLAPGAAEGGRFTLNFGNTATEAKFVGPGELTALVPDNVPIATVTATLQQGETQWEGRIRITRQAPGIAANGAYWSQIVNGATVRIQAMQADQPFSLSEWRNPAASVLTLTLFGTGWRGSAAASQIFVYFNATRLPVLAYGPHETFPGVDYVTVQIPASFRAPTGATLTPLTRLRMTAGNVNSNNIDLLIVP